MSYVIWLGLATRDWTDIRTRNWKYLVYLGRYGKQQIDHTRHWPLSELNRACMQVSDMLKEEASKSST